MGTSVPEFVKPVIVGPKKAEPGSIVGPSALQHNAPRGVVSPSIPCNARPVWNPPVVNRLQAADLSGFYEQQGGFAQQRVILQVAVAGQALVGWYSVPPAKSGYADLASWPTGIAARPPNPPNNRPDAPFVPDHGGVFVVDPQQKFRNGSQMHWLPDWPAKDTGVWATESPRANKLDPHDLLSSLEHSAELVRTGTFRVHRLPARDEPIIALRFDDQSSKEDLFIRYRPSLRLPSSVAMAMPPGNVRSKLLSEYIQPLPPSWVEEICDRLVSKSAEILLQKWQDSPQGVARRTSRSLIDIHVAIAGLRDLPGAHHAALLSRIRALLISTKATLNKITRSFQAWYEQVAAEEADDNQGRQPKELEALKLLGIVPPPKQRTAGYAYVLTFLKFKKGVSRIVKASIAGFSLTVRKVKVEFLLDQHGSWITDLNGVPSLKNPKVLTDPSVGEQFGGRLEDLLIGFFFDIGVGLGITVDTGLSGPDGAPSAEKKNLGGDALGGVTLFSYVSLGEEHFDGATFRITALKGPASSFGNFTGFNLFSSIYHEYHLSDGHVLTAVETEAIKWSPPELPKWSMIFGGLEGLKKYIERWTSAKGEGKLFEVSFGLGVIRKLGSVIITDDAVLPLPKPDAVYAASQGSTFFDQDKASLRQGRDITRDGRYLLECLLAEYRALIVDTVETEPYVEVQGYTSPEDSQCRNMQLSEDRARAVVQAMKDAYGPAFHARMKASGLGEIPSLKDGHLHDPPDDVTGRAKFNKQYPAEEPQWPFWRKVEIKFQGRTLITGYAKPS